MIGLKGKYKYKHPKDNILGLNRTSIESDPIDVDVCVTP